MGKIFKFAESEIQHSGVTAKPKFDVIELLPEQEGTLTYNGSEQRPTWRNLDPLKMLVTGEKSAVNAGVHTITVTPQGNFGWSDNTQNPRTFEWIINRKKIATVPSQKGSLTFNNSPQTPQWNNFSTDELDISGTFQDQIDASTYTAVFTPNSNHCWNDGSTVSKNVFWTIAFLKLTKPSASNTKISYTGSTVTLSVSNYNSAYMSQEGTISATERGNYQAIYRLHNSTNTKWLDGSTADVVINWEITARQITKPILAVTSFEWTFIAGHAVNQSPSIQSFNASLMTKSGTETASAVGSYQIRIALIDKTSTCWSGGGTDDVILNWQITKHKSAKIYFSTTEVEYTGYNRTVTAVNFDTNAQNYITASNSIYSEGRKACGTYTTTFTIKDTANCCWSDGSIAPITCSWQIIPKTLATPVPEYDDEDFGAFVYTGSEITANFTNFDSSKMTVTGNKATTTGTKTAKFTITDSNYCFAGKASSVNVSWKIDKEEINFTAPSQIAFVMDDDSVGDIITRYVNIKENPMFSYTSRRKGFWVYCQYPINCNYDMVEDNISWVPIPREDWIRYVTISPPPAGWTEDCWLITSVNPSRGGTVKITFTDTSGIKKSHTTTLFKMT